MSLGDTLNEAIAFCYECIWETPESFPWFVILLVGTGIFVTFRMGWIQIRLFTHAINVIRGKYDNPDDAGDISHFQALTTALSATVGVGNIAGVALAIHGGGPGALFWMWITAVFGMALKFTECTLSMNYRTIDERNRAAGGPMYYIEKGFGKGWKWLACLFAFCAAVSSFGIGNMNQANTIALSAHRDLQVNDWITGIVVALLVGLVIIGGIKRIGKVTSRLAPFMAVFYVLGGLLILLLNIEKIPELLGTIFSGAFTPRAGLGGTAAGVFSLTLLEGIKRGLFSNESGMGSAPIAHAAAKTKEPVREGVVAMIGPFIDTITICTITGLVILVTGVWNTKTSNNAELVDARVLSAPLELKSDRELAELEKFQGNLTFVEGKTGEKIVFKFNDGSVEDPVLLHGGEPFTGSILVEEGKPETPEGISKTLEIKGKMLLNSSALTAWAFQKGLSDVFPFGNMLVTFAVFLFAISTIISWSYYGDRSVHYLFGYKGTAVYKLIFIVFIYIGATQRLEAVWTYGDLWLGLMCVPNLFAVFVLSGKVGRLTKEYLSRKHVPLR